MIFKITNLVSGEEQIFANTNLPNIATNNLVNFQVVGRKVQELNIWLIHSTSLMEGRC